MEIGNLPDRQFKVMIIKMFKPLRRKLDEKIEKSEVFNRVGKYKEELGRDEEYMKNTLEGIKNKLEKTQRYGPAS